MIAYYCVEDALSRAVVVRLLKQLLGDVYLTELQPNQGGFGSMRNKFGNYCKLAARHRVFILTDLDRADCPPSLRAAWMNDARLIDPLPEKMSFNIAVTEVEAWLIADRDNLSEFLGVPRRALPENTEIADPKEHLLNCVRRHGNREAKSQLLPRGTAKIGLGYNMHLSTFATERWDFEAASTRSVSLRRAVTRMAAARE